MELGRGGGDGGGSGEVSVAGKGVCSRGAAIVLLRVSNQLRLLHLAFDCGDSFGFAGFAFSFLWWRRSKFLLLKFVVHSIKSRRRADANIGVTPL